MANSIKDEIELFKAEVYYPNFSNDIAEQVQNFLEKISSRDYLKSLDSIELKEMAALCEIYSLGLLTHENRLKAYAGWCEGTIKKIVGSALPEAFGFGFQEKDLWVREYNEEARELNGQKIVAEAKLACIQNLSHKIHYIGERLENLAREKGQVMRNINRG